MSGNNKELEALVAVYKHETKGWRYTLLRGDVSGEEFVHINSLDKYSPSSVVVRRAELETLLNKCLTFTGKSL